jgi:hypothetical protein
MSSFTHSVWDSAWSEVAARQQLKSKNPPPPDLPEEPTDTELLRELEALGFQRGKSVYFKSISEIMSELNSPLLLLLED